MPKKKVDKPPFEEFKKRFYYYFFGPGSKPGDEHWVDIRDSKLKELLHRYWTDPKLPGPDELISIVKFKSASDYSANTEDESGRLWLVNELERAFKMARAECWYLEGKVVPVSEERWNDSELEKEKLEKPLERPTKFNPQKYGGRELCIVVSYNKAGERKLAKLAKILTHKGKITYENEYENPITWYDDKPSGFKQHAHKLRKKAKEAEWWDSIPADYYHKYI
ncbi:hypothetical protein MYX78_11220, partial [Acidobacteria bacterium AH-259-G07]|nr:hypothetical protein [Acidobacteria bacterium AH-259-G07]